MNNVGPPVTNAGPAVNDTGPSVNNVGLSVLFCVLPRLVPRSHRDSKEEVVFHPPWPEIGKT